MTTRAADLVLDTLTMEQEDRVLVVRVCAPPYNYMTAQMQNDLDTLTSAVDADTTVGAVILTGGVPHRYITHFDIADILAGATRNGYHLSADTIRGLQTGLGHLTAVPGVRTAIEHTPIGGLLHITRFTNVAQRIMRSPAVYIAAIAGPCGGGGLELSVCFDVRLAADDDTTGFMLPELLIGLTTTVGGQRLAQLIGPARALEFMLQGRRYTPQEAAQMGLVNRVMPADTLLNEAKDLAAVYARRNRDTVAAQKRIFHEHLSLTPAESLRREAATSASAMTADPAARALQKWVDMQTEDVGDSVFLTRPEPWIRGEAVDLNIHHSVGTQPRD